MYMKEEVAVPRHIGGLSPEVSRAFMRFDFTTARTLWIHDTEGRPASSPYDDDLFDAFVEALWRGDTDLLGDLAHCDCCCDEHTSYACPARAWNDCRGQDDLDLDEESWYRVYAISRGMTRADFFCFGQWGEGERPPNATISDILHSEIATPVRP